VQFLIEIMDLGSRHEMPNEYGNCEDGADSQDRLEMHEKIEGWNMSDDLKTKPLE